MPAKTQSKNQSGFFTAEGGYQIDLDPAGCTLAHAGQPVEFHRKAVIFREGEAVEGIYFVHSGQAKLVKATDRGRLQVLRFAKPGDWLGLRDLQFPRHEHSAIALSPLQTIFVPRADLERHMNENHEISLHILRCLGTELEQVEQRLCGNARRTARARVAETLLYLAESFGYTRNRYLAISVTMKDLAGYVGTTVETLSRVMRDFREHRYLRIVNKNIQLLEPNRLEQIAQLTAEKMPE